MTDNSEHPALKAARAIKQMHVDNIAKIDSGFVFHKKLENGEYADCNAEMRAACVEQIALCDGIIENASTVSNPALLEPIALMLVDAKATIEKALEDAKEPLLPEIGNYDNDDPPAA